ncbi:MAG: pyridoxal phosphate-dependent aminotransferase family protein [Verrucomicrobia bacterium]|nr:pyridoxal phosphate-dependent aminotransferase family protein [Verrucomicrobiota bacterium]
MSQLAPPLQQVDRTRVLWRGRKLIYFGGCDYFRLASHPAVLRAMRGGLKKFGLNVSASRKTTGNHALYEKLERQLARFFGSESAVLVSNGYVTNPAVAQALAGEFTHVLLDAKAHASLQDAAPMFGAKVIRFLHRDATAVAQALRRLRRGAKPVLLTDGVFSHDGSIAPLADYLKLLPRTGRILVDDAHGAGVLGKRGRGTVEFAGVGRERIIRTITLSKAFGVYGGAVVASRDVCERITERSRLFTGNTPLPLPLAAAALKSLEIFRTNKAMRQCLAVNTVAVKKILRHRGLPMTDTPSPIIAVMPHDEKHARRLHRALLAAGIYPSFICYPGGPESGYFRFAISSEHTPLQLGQLVKVLSFYGRHVEVH